MDKKETKKKIKNTKLEIAELVKALDEDGADILLGDEHILDPADGDAPVLDLGPQVEPTDRLVEEFDGVGIALFQQVEAGGGEQKECQNAVGCDKEQG